MYILSVYLLILVHTLTGNFKQFACLVSISRISERFTERIKNVIWC